MTGKRTKIVCTLGPASSSVSMLTKMINAGMNVARLNFSHGTHEEHEVLIKNVRAAAKKTGNTIAILQDLQGPRIRIGELPEDGIRLSKGQLVHFTPSHKKYFPGDSIPVTHSSFHKDVKRGNRILMDDGLLEVVVTSVRQKSIATKVVVGGILKSRKGVSLPDSTVSVSAFTKKDHDDLLFGLEQAVDWVAISFVTSPAVIHKVREITIAKCRQLGCVPPRIMAKIEKREAVDNFLEILDASDAIMLARGDLGIELPPEEVPIIQKEFVEICRQAGKPLVVATHMLDSMSENPRATRAETSDVANAVFDHADAVTLSQETAIGKYPEVAVKAMNAVILEAEAARIDDISFYQLHDIPDIATAVAQALHVMGENNQIDFIITSSTYGPAAQMINIFRPNASIIVACPDIARARQLMIHSGIYTIVHSDEPASFISRMETKLRKARVLNSKHRVAYVTASPAGQTQLTIKAMQR